MKILVTGATGFIGSHIIEELAKQGLGLRAAYRPGDHFHQVDSDFLIDGLDMETFPLELTDRSAVRHALRGCQILFHAEHLVSFAHRDKARLYQVNHLGTKVLMEEALNQGVEKVIYTSGMELLRAPPGQEIATEADGVSLEDLKTHFEKSRYLAEREISHLKARGLPVVIVHPTVCLGKRDQGRTPFGLYLKRFLQGKTRFLMDSGLNLVDVVDVAKAHLLAAKRGEVGGRYLLGNQNVYLLELFNQLESMTGIRAPQTALPWILARWGKLILSLVFRHQSGIPGKLIPRLKQPLFYSSAKAVSELGMPQSDVWAALKREVEDLLKAIP